MPHVRSTDKITRTPTFPQMAQYEHPDVAQGTWKLAILSLAYLSDTRTGTRPRPPRQLSTISLGPLVGLGDNSYSVNKGQAGVGFGEGRVVRERGRVPYPVVYSWLPVCFFGIKFVLSDLVFGSHGLVLCGNFPLGSPAFNPCLLGGKGK